MNGFTLTEIIVVLALIGVIASFTAFQDLSSYKRLLVGIEANKIKTALVKARGEAMNGICFDNSCDISPSHGVKLTEHEAIVFEGPSYEMRISNADLKFPFEATTVISGMSEIIFTPITGEPLEEGVVTISNMSSTTWQIHINNLGMIESHVHPL